MWYLVCLQIQSSKTFKHVNRLASNPKLCLIFVETMCFLGRSEACCGLVAEIKPALMSRFHSGFVGTVSYCTSLYVRTEWANVLGPRTSSIPRHHAEGGGAPSTPSANNLSRPFYRVGTPCLSHATSEGRGWPRTNSTPRVRNSGESAEDIDVREASWFTSKNQGVLSLELFIHVRHANWQTMFITPICKSLRTRK